ncbi:MAG TPA: AtpZ/AtpI family protein [Oscillatoriales cyanobacterium M59_W2019_021]|nr:MAG: ATP synthase subunit [Cyanobacteria bacterium J055]HIK30469.1 AtpZ/AtpI family protein [Oscillatoriales cyanobacterium M4454_W2019_049]HIK49425.1 AtpZ/AtpI family protein [Oscillatoriales cyanobacterium M59_W2019_021]
MDEPDDDRNNDRAIWQTFHKQVETKADRKIQARREKKNIWFAIGMFGMVGWSVTVPALLCIALGVWIDTRFPSRYSWTLMLLLVGIVLGCINAWYWIKKESDRH